MNGWRSVQGDPSLVESFRTIGIAQRGNWFRKILAFSGPGYLVAVGYMDPGNWATALSGGSKFGFTLLTVALLSNLMAILLQALTIRLALASGRDLAQACRDGFPKWLNLPLWLLAEIAIIATDLAEVIGTAIALQLLFGIPLIYGVVITGLDVMLILWLQNKGFRWIEAIIISMLMVIAVCFGLQILLASPDWGGVLRGFVPNIEIVRNPDMLYLALGIIGATVMPHNLYLHSAIVQTRAVPRAIKQKKQALKLATFDSTLALSMALFINASILILAASVFWQNGYEDVVSLEKAHYLLQPILGSELAPILFAVALLCCGLSSTITATMAGQVVMEGFLNIRIQPWLRRLITRIIAILPALVVTAYYGMAGTGKLLILSQVVLSFQLPFAIIPLVLFTSSRKKMGALVSPMILTLLAAMIAMLLVLLNARVVWDFLFA